MIYLLSIFFKSILTVVTTTRYQCKSKQDSPMAQGVGPKVKECLDHMLRLFSLTERERERERERDRLRPSSAFLLFTLYLTIGDLCRNGTFFPQKSRTEIVGRLQKRRNGNYKERGAKPRKRGGKG